MSAKTTIRIYAFTTLLCIAINYIYSYFGHGVSSAYMTYAFLFSLILGVAGFMVINQLNLNNRMAFNLYNAGIATLTVGSILRGILDIAGADTIYPLYYFSIGALLVVVGVNLYAFQWTRSFRLDH